MQIHTSNHAIMFIVTTTAYCKRSEDVVSQIQTSIQACLLIPTHINFPAHVAYTNKHTPSGAPRLHIYTQFTTPVG